MNEQVRKVVIPAIAGVAGLSVGGVLGYMLGQRKLRHRPTFDRDRETITQQSLDAMKAYNEYDVEQTRVIHEGRLHSVSLVTDEGAPGHIVRAEVIEALSETNIPEESQEEIVRNIFDDADPNWDWEGELISRSYKTLYVITKAEFFADDMGYRQSTITWYEGDKTMADEREAPIYNWSSIVGTELQFGHGSGDEDVVYIRNEELRHEYEVCRDPGAHGVEVGGMEIEDEYDEQDIRHSRYPMKFRME